MIQSKHIVGIASSAALWAMPFYAFSTPAVSMETEREKSGIVEQAPTITKPSLQNARIDLKDRFTESAAARQQAAALLGLVAMGLSQQAGPGGGIGLGPMK